MSAILNSLNTHNFTIFQPILMELVSKSMVKKALSNKTLIIRVAVPFNVLTTTELLHGFLNLMIYALIE